MTKKQIKGKKEFMVFIPDVKTHTGHMVGEVKFYSFKCVSPELEWTVKSNQILFLFKDIASQYTKFSCFLFSTECWHFATNRFPPGKRNTSKCRCYTRRKRNAKIFKPVSLNWNIWQNYWPPKLNKRFYPRLKTIRSHMVKAIKKLRY